MSGACQRYILSYRVKLANMNDKHSQRFYIKTVTGGLPPPMRPLTTSF